MLDGTFAEPVLRDLAEAPPRRGGAPVPVERMRWTR